MSTQDKLIQRKRRKARIRKKVTGTGDRPRLTVFRSNKHIYAQVIDDATGRTLVAASDRDRSLAGAGKKAERAQSVGAALAKACIECGIKHVVFDRNGYMYHGRVMALATGAREGGLDF